MSGEAINLRIAELLAARLCHELVSPIGAISNGLEILEDEPNFAQDAGALIGLSARQASRRLQFYRIAYGATTALADDLVRCAAEALFADGKIELEWLSGALPENWQKLACNLLLVAAEALPRGGRVVLEAGAHGGMTVTAAGEGARLSAPVAAQLAHCAHADELSPRTVQAAFAAALAHRAGAGIDIRQDDANRLTLVVTTKFRPA
jgi:histidine phosphotransferase ChpT